MKIAWIADNNYNIIKLAGSGFVIGCKRSIQEKIGAGHHFIRQCGSSAVNFLPMHKVSGHFSTIHGKRGIELKIDIRTQIHFYDDDTAYVEIMNGSDVGDERFGEILLLCCFIARVLNTLKRSPAITELAEHLYGLNAQNINEIRLDESSAIVQQKHRYGGKRFINSLKYGKDFLRYNMSTRGFGFLALKIYDYAPNAVYLMIIKFMQRRQNDQEFIAWMARAASISGEMFLTEQYTMRNQNQMAYNATLQGKESQ